MRNAEIRKDIVVKLELADQQFVNAGQKRARLRALDDAVIVGAADGDRFADAELRQRFRRHRLVLRRILDRAGGNDQRLAGHQSRRRSDGADGSGIGERNGCALEIGNLKFAVARAFHYVVVGLKEFGEAQFAGVLDVGNEQRARAVFLRQINRNAEIDTLTPNADRISVDDIEAVIELRKLIERAQQRPGDQMRVGSFAAIVLLEMLVDEAAVFVE